MKKNQRWFILISVLISLCIVCGVAVFAIDSIENPTPTATMITENNIEIIIANTYNAAQTQTAIAAPPTQIISESPTSFVQSTLVPTWTPIPTETLFVLTLVTVPVNDQTNQCICTEDTYNCGDPLEQVCFNYCNTNGFGDIHRLDNNNNGVACDNP